MCTIWTAMKQGDFLALLLITYIYKVYKNKTFKSIRSPFPHFSFLKVEVQYIKCIVESGVAMGGMGGNCPFPLLAKDVPQIF